MTSHVRRVNVITRQRLLSDDFNNVGRMYGRALCLGELASSLGDAYLDSGFGTGGVVGGFLVEAIVGSNRIKVQPGIAVVETAPGSATFDPPVNWISLDEETEVDLDSLVDATNPRLVTIEIEPVDATLVTGVADVFDKNTGTFGVDPSAARVLGSAPTINPNAGTAAANPVVAAGSSGKVPIAVVKLVASQASFTDAYASVLMCRPLLQAPSHRIAPSDYVRGGGVSVGEESGGSLVNLTDLYLNKLTCSLLGLEAEVAGLIPFSTLGRTPNSTSPAALLSSVQPVYGYAVPPPWEANAYGITAPREAWQRNPNQVPFANAQNIVGGSGSTFTSLSAETATSPGLTHRNAIVAWDNQAAVGAERGAGNAPVQIIDARGPHPDHAPGGSGTMTLDATQDPAWGATQQATDSVYLGSVAALNIAADFMGQASRRAKVFSLDKVDAAGAFAATRRPVSAYTTTSVDQIYPGNFPSHLVGDTEIIPEFAEEIEVYYAWLAGNGPGVAEFQLYPSVGYGRPETFAVPLAGANGKIDTATADDYERKDVVAMKRNAAGAITKGLGVAASATQLTVILNAYIDPFIEAR